MITWCRVSRCLCPPGLDFPWCLRRQIRLNLWWASRSAACATVQYALGWLGHARTDLDWLTNAKFLWHVCLSINDSQGAFRPQLLQQQAQSTAADLKRTMCDVQRPAEFASMFGQYLAKWAPLRTRQPNPEKEALVRRRCDTLRSQATTPGKTLWVSSSAQSVFASLSHSSIRLHNCWTGSICGLVGIHARHSAMMAMT